MVTSTDVLGSKAQIPSKVANKDRILLKEDEITASIKAGNAGLSISTDPNPKTIKPNRKSGGSSRKQPAPEAKSDSSSQKRKAFTPKQGTVHNFDPLRNHFVVRNQSRARKI